MTALHLLLLWSLTGAGLPAPAVAPATEVVSVALLAPAGPPRAPGAAAPSGTPATKPRAGPAARPAAPTAASVTDPETAATDTPQPDAVSPGADASGPAAQTAALPGQPAEQPAGTPARPVQAPVPIRLGYELAGQVKGLRYSADAVLDWRQDGRNYQAQMEVRAFLIGSRSQTSTGQLGPGGLQPERFVDRARRERITEFDQDAGLVRTEAGDHGLAMPGGTQDRLSVFIQLAIELSTLPQPPGPGDSWTLPVAASREIERWTFDWRGTEELELPSGRLLTWHLERQPLQAGETRVEIWLAPELGFMPARLRLQQENGDSMDQRLLRR